MRSTRSNADGVPLPGQPHDGPIKGDQQSDHLLALLAPRPYQGIIAKPWHMAKDGQNMFFTFFLCPCCVEAGHDLRPASAADGRVVGQVFHRCAAARARRPVDSDDARVKRARSAMSRNVMGAGTPGAESLEQYPGIRLEASTSRPLVRRPLVRKPLVRRPLVPLSVWPPALQVVVVPCRAAVGLTLRVPILTGRASQRPADSSQEA